MKTYDEKLKEAVIYLSNNQNLSIHHAAVKHGVKAGDLHRAWREFSYRKVIS